MKKTLLSVATVTALTGIASHNISAADYTVENGDTLWGLANENGTSVSSLKEVNGLSSDLIFPGDVIELGGESNEAPAEEETAKENDGTYVIEPGDTLYKIGQKFGVDYNQIMEWNNLSSDMIFAGKTLIVSADAAPAAASVEEAPQTEEAPAAEEAPRAEEETEDQNTAQAAEVQEAPAVVEEDNSADEQAAEQQAAEQRAAEQERIEQREAEQAEAEQEKQEAQAAAPQQTSNVSGGNAVSVAQSVAAGKSYVYGGNSASAVDCSALTQQFMQAYKGKTIPRTAAAQKAAGTPTSNPQPGDLVFFNGGSHVGIYIGNGQMIDALNPSEGVGERSVSYVHGSVDGYYTY